MGEVTGVCRCYLWVCLWHLILKHRNKWSLSDLKPTLARNVGELFLRRQSLYLYLIPGPALQSPLGRFHLGGNCRVTESGGKADTGWDRQPLERERLTHLILISWELIALKAQVSHIMPAVKINSPFNGNLNHKTGSHQKAKMTQLLHSKRISLKAGPHWKHHGGGPFIYGKKIIRRQWRCTDKLTHCSCFLEVIL